MLRQQKESVIDRLNRSVVINLLFIVALTIFFVLASLFIQFHQNQLDQFVNEKITLEHLDSLISETGEGLLRVLVKGKGKGNSKAILEILSKSEDFQFAFDSYYYSTTHRKGLSDLSLAREVEPVITALRAAIVKIVAFYNVGDFDSAQNYYQQHLCITLIKK